MTQLSAIPPKTGVAPPLALRRVGDGDVTMVLPTGKATIGSGPSCTVRLTEPGVRPLHCLITRTDAGLTVRRWSDATLLNGKPFSESPLMSGDRLSLGPIDLELIECTPQAIAPAIASTITHTNKQLEKQAIGFPGLQLPTPSTVVSVAIAPPKPALNTLPSNSEDRRRTRRMIQELRRLRDHQSTELGQLSDLKSDLEFARQECQSVELQRAALELQVTKLQSERKTCRVELNGLRQVDQPTTERLVKLEALITERDQLLQELTAELMQYRTKHTAVTLQTSKNITETSIESAAVEPLANPASEAPTSETDFAIVEPSTPDTVEPITIEYVKKEEATSESPESIDWTLQQVEPVVEAVVESFPVVEKAIEAEDLWGFGQPAEESQAGDSSAVDELESIENDAKANTGSEIPWDIELHSDSFAQPEIAPHADRVSTAEHSTEESTDDMAEDIWGRINLLRAEASEKLHTETTHATEVTSSSLWQRDEATSESLLFRHTPSAPQEMTPEHDSEDLWGTESTGSQVSLVQSALPTALLEAEPQVETEPVPRPEPVSFVEKYKHLLEEDSNDSLLSRNIEPLVKRVEEVKPTLSGDDESIEDYMAKMMSRLRGREEAPAYESTQPVNTPKVAAKPTAASAESANQARATAEPEEPALPLECLSQLKVAPKPEQSTDMTALRALANTSAREAIKISNSKRARETAYANLAMGCLAGGMGAYLVWASNGSFDMSLLGGVAAVTAAGVWVMRTLKSLGQRSTLPTTSSVYAAEEVALPIAGSDAT